MENTLVQTECEIDVFDFVDGGDVIITFHQYINMNAHTEKQVVGKVFLETK